MGTVSVRGLPAGRIREIDPHSDAEIRLVAERMRQTLIEVLGEERGTAMYSMDWLRDRVRFHLDPSLSDAKVFLWDACLAPASESPEIREPITAHAIARVERTPEGVPFGYFSTVFVEPHSRRHGIARRLLEHVEAWFRAKELPKSVYNTAKDHVNLIALFKAHGYAITDEAPEMVQLTKAL